MTNQINKVNDPTVNKLTPRNIEAEESIISAILLDNSTLLDVVEILAPDDFYVTKHQIIYKSTTSLFTKSEPIDLITLTNELKQKGQLEEIGGATYLSKIYDTAPLPSNAEHYAKIIRDKSSLRKLILKANSIVQRCFEEGGDVESIIDFAENAVFEVADSKVKSSFSSIGELIDKNIDTLEKAKGNETGITGIPTGYKNLNKLTSGFQNSDLIIIAARPSMGKTAFALNLARNVAVDANIPVALFSLEMSKEQLSMRLLTSEARVDSARLKSGFTTNDDWANITNAAGVLDQSPIFIDDTFNISTMEIRAKARRLKMESDLGLIIIDYIQLMKTSTRQDRRDLEIAEMSRSLKGLAKELNIPIIALSQLNRMLEQRAEKRPMLSDLRESGSLEQDADIVAFIYRDEVYNKEESNPNKGKAEIILSKNRNGATGTAFMSFIGKYTRFEELAHGEYPEYSEN